MKVIIADDSELMRVRLTELLERIDHVEVVGEARNAIEAKELINKTKPDVIVLDIRMPGGSGLEVLRDLKGTENKFKIIMLTNYPYPQYRDKCIEEGADYFLSKSDEFDKLGDVMNEIYQNHFMT